MNKKYFFLLAALFCIMGGVKAQTLSDAITQASNLTNDGLYTIESAGRGHLLYDTTYPNNISSTSTSGITNTNPTGATNELFCIIHTPGMTAGQYYLFSVGAGKFAGYSGTSGVLDFVTYDEPNTKCIVTLTPGSNSNGTGFVFKFPNAGTNYRINVTNPTNGAKAYGVKINNNTDVDDGSIMVVKRCTGVTFDGYAAMMRKVYDVDGTTAIKTNCESKVGYPKTSTTAYRNFESAFESGTLASSHLSALYGVTDVNMPEDGKAYTFTFKHMDGTRTYLYWNGSKITSAVLGTGEALPETAIFVCHKVDTKYMFVNPSSGNYLVWWGGSGDGAYESNNGYTSAYDSGKNLFQVIKFQTSDNVQATYQELFGCVGLKGTRSSGDAPYFILKNTAGGAVASSDPYVDKTTTNANYRSCAVMIEEVDYYNKLVFRSPATPDGKYYASIYLPYAATVPTGATAYLGTLNGSKITLTDIESTVIPKNTAVVMVAESDLATQYIAPAITTGSVPSGVTNTFKGTLTTTPKADALLADTYVLNGSFGNIGFYKYTATNLPKGRAYFEVVSSGVKGFLFDFGDEEGETTGINAAALSEGNTAKTYYDLSGRRIANPKNGLYICNGKKVYIK